MGGGGGSAGPLGSITFQTLQQPDSLVPRVVVVPRSTLRTFRSAFVADMLLLLWRRNPGHNDDKNENTVPYIASMNTGRSAPCFQGGGATLRTFAMLGGGVCPPGKNTSDCFVRTALPAPRASV